MMAYDCCSVQWYFVMVCIVDVQYSGQFKRKKSESLVLASDFHHIHNNMITCYIVDW